PLSSCFHLLRSAAPPLLPSFPPRRSSDLAHGLLAPDAGQLLDLRVPALDPVLQIDRQDPDVDRFDDVLAELLEPLVFFDLALQRDRKSTRLNSSHQIISYAVFCLIKINIL